MATAAARTRVFVSYSHKDQRWLDELGTYLAPLEPVLDLWDDRRQEPGRRWLPQIEQALREAKVGLLLISPDFMASRFIQEHEVPRLLRRADDDGVPLLCVYVRAALVERGFTSRDPVTGETRTVRLPEFQWLNDPERTSFPRRAAAAMSAFGVWRWFREGRTADLPARGPRCARAVLVNLVSLSPSRLVGGGTGKGGRAPEAVSGGMGLRARAASSQRSD